MKECFCPAVFRKLPFFMVMFQVDLTLCTILTCVCSCVCACMHTHAWVHMYVCVYVYICVRACRVQRSPSRVISQEPSIFRLIQGLSLGPEAHRLGQAGWDPRVSVSWCWHYKDISTCLACFGGAAGVQTQPPMLI